MNTSRVDNFHRLVQLTLGGLWIIDGLLQLQPAMFSKEFVSNVLAPVIQGQPHLAGSLLRLNENLISVHVGAWNLVFAGVQLLIGFGIIMRPTLKPALAISFAWSLGVWTLGEGFGMLFTGSASPLTGAPGAVILYLALGLIVWPRPIRDNQGRAVSLASHGLLGDRPTTWLWAGLWTVSGILWLLPANLTKGALGAQIIQAGQGQPSWLSSLDNSVGSSLKASGLHLGVCLFVVSLVIGFGPIVSERRTLFVVIGGALSCVYWVFGQAFGGIFTVFSHGTGTDLNSGPLIVIIGICLVTWKSTEAKMSSGQTCTNNPFVWRPVELEGVMN